MHFIISVLDKISIIGCSMIYKLRIFSLVVDLNFLPRFMVAGWGAGASNIQPVRLAIGWLLVTGLFREKSTIG
jgi:hypothetical protein